MCGAGEGCGAALQQHSHPHCRRERRVVSEAAAAGRGSARQPSRLSAPLALAPAGPRALTCPAPPAVPGAPSWPPARYGTAPASPQSPRLPACRATARQALRGVAGQGAAQHLSRQRNAAASPCASPSAAAPPPASCRHTLCPRTHAPVVLQLRPHDLHLQLHLPLAVVLQDVLVGLALDGPLVVVAVGAHLGRAPQVELVGLNIPAGARAAGREQADACEGRGSASVASMMQAYKNRAPPSTTPALQQAQTPTVVHLGRAWVCGGAQGACGPVMIGCRPLDARRLRWLGQGTDRKE